MKDVASLKLAADGQVIIKGAQGITGTPKTATFTIGIILVLLTLFIVLNIINSRTGRAIMRSATTVLRQSLSASTSPSSS